MVGSLALLFGAAYGLTRFAVWAKRRLLWRVRRKLILSYVFVGVVPALLVITFFLLAGLILAFNVSSYLVQSRVRNLTDQARFLAQTVLLEVQRSGHAGCDRRSARAPPGRAPKRGIRSSRSPSCRCRTWRARSSRATRRACHAALPATLPVAAGPWGHLPPPATLPKWVGCDGFAGIVAYNAPSKQRRGLGSRTRGW